MSTSNDECQMSNDEGMTKSESRNASAGLRHWSFDFFVIRHSCFVISSTFRSLAYLAGRLFVKLLFGCVARVRVLRRENGNRVGGFLLAANHISHFDPFLISLAVRRKIDWMTMAEFFRSPTLGFLLRAIDAFPAERDRADLKTIRTAIERLKSGRVVGLFPEGGIRDGTRSLLEGAPLRPGASTLAQIAGVPVLPCVILGSDRLYSKRQWLLPCRRDTPIWIAFGDPISHFPELQKSQARQRIESELAAAFRNLYAELREKFRLTADDLPHPPQERMKQCRASASLARPWKRQPKRLPYNFQRSVEASCFRFSRFTTLRVAEPASGAAPAEWSQPRGDGALRDEMRAAHPAGILRGAARTGSREDACKWTRDDGVEQPDQDTFCGKQRRSRRILSVPRPRDPRAHGIAAARAHVHQPRGPSPLRRTLQRTWLERLFPSPALSLFACSARLLEWRTCDHLRSHSQCRRIAPGRNRIAAVDGCIEGTRLPRVCRSRYQLWRLDRRVADAG